MTYTTGKVDKDGFKFVRTEDAKENPSFNEDGKETTGNFKPGVKQEITYVYEKTESEWTPIEEIGKFQEHHIYQTVDKNGKVISTDETKDKDATEGTEKENYKTSKEDKDGYKLVKIESKNGGKFNEDGSEKEAAYIANTKQEVTYIYQRTKEEPTEEKGSFQEHHIYITKDKDGKIIKREVVNDKVDSGTNDKTYTTGKKEKDGFKFVKTQDPKENPKYDKDGKETTGNFVPGKTQEITYVYEKTETPWTPLTPAEEVTPQTPDVKKTPKEDSKETPKDGSKETSEKQSKKLPKAGADYELLKLAAGALTIVSGFGISVSRKKRD